MNGMGVETNGLPIAIVMIGERFLHVLKRSRVVRLGFTIGIVAVRSKFNPRKQVHRSITYSQGSIKCGPATPALSKKAYMGISQNPGS
jgi:hypothetical protein